MSGLRISSCREGSSRDHAAPSFSQGCGVVDVNCAACVLTCMVLAGLQLCTILNDRRERSAMARHWTFWPWDSKRRPTRPAPGAAARNSLTMTTGSQKSDACPMHPIQDTKGGRRLKAGDPTCPAGLTYPAPRGGETGLRCYRCCSCSARATVRRDVRSLLSCDHRCRLLGTAART